MPPPTDSSSGRGADVRDVPAQGRPKTVTSGSLQTALLQCCHCGKDQAGGFKLHKCAGCGIMMYCGKECQRAAWPKHRLQCASKKKAASGAPACEPAAWDYRELLNGFLQAHANAMKWLVKANVLNTVGPAAMCSFDPPYVMTFVGHPRPPWPSDSRQTNPATAFEVDKIYIEPLPDSSPEYLESIHISPKIREFKDKEYRARYGSRYAGLLPLRWEIFLGTQRTVSDACFIALTHPYEPAPPLPEAQRKTALADVVNFCVASMNGGFPLRFSDGPGAVVAFPGKFVREKKEWVWKPLFLDWDEYARKAGGHKGLDSAIRELSPGTTPATLSQFIASLPIV